MIARLARMGVIVAALAAAWLLTPRAAPAPVQSSGHQHGTLAADSAHPVQLSQADQRRIGVTYAPVIRGSLERTVRVVAQVAYDETRVVTVAPRIDGWAERLFVDFTGQQVRSGEPLLRLYSPMLTTAGEELLLARRLQGQVTAGTTDAQDQADRLASSARRRLEVLGLSAVEIQRIEDAGEAPRTVTIRAPAAGVVVEKRGPSRPAHHGGRPALSHRRPERGVARGRCVRTGPGRGPRRPAGDRRVPGAPRRRPYRPDRLHLPDSQHRNPDRPGAGRPGEPGARAQAGDVRDASGSRLPPSGPCSASHAPRYSRPANGISSS